ncbi:uncharacterized protein HKW66_Vig0238580 [Vigna angularis]|uniref:Uncharacterized protein n=1 Tax=Phaseolus angularis TaxID=3914 RepID=A0A8T0KT83_PHAAN|nr:uncharacterized protein HKW66_Vig0238580 [Vigna angularis]
MSSQDGSQALKKKGKTKVAQVKIERLQLRRGAVDANTAACVVRSGPATKGGVEGIASSQVVSSLSRSAAGRSPESRRSVGCEVDQKEGFSALGMNVEYMDDVVFGLDLVIVMEEERGEQSDKGSDRTKKLVFRHYCRSKMIGVLNERLTIEQKGYIEKSVFGWLLYLPSSIKIGLPVVGEAIDLNKVGHRSVCREYFPEGKVDVRMVWFCHHFVTSKSIYSTRVTKFPRLLNWIDMNIGDKFMKTALAKGSVVIDVGVSKEELCYGMVKDACEKFGIPFKKQNRGDKEKLLIVVEEQTRVIADMQSSINDLRKLVEAKNEDKNEEFVEEPLWGSEDGCQSTPVQHDQQTPVVERGFQMQQSTMYDRMKAQPRIRVKSVVKRSPYTAGVRRKK